MKIYLATDHAGFELKEKIKKYLVENSYQVQDFGALVYDAKDDYPDFVKFVAGALSVDLENSLAIILGGSGQGEAMVANRYPRVRAAVFYGPRPVADPFLPVRLAREHNNANILSLGARLMSDEEALEAVRVFIATLFSGDERHERRLAKF